MRLSESVIVAAPKGAVWEYLADLDNYLEFLSGITRWERDGEQASGLGARRRMLIRVGSAEVGGLIEIVEWDAPNDLAWSSVTGVDQRGRLRLRDAGPASTRVEMRFQYGVAGGGLAGWISEHVSAPTLRRHLRDSLRGLKQIIERRQAVPGPAAGGAAAGG
jgi:uncharacterized membrane protein